VYAPTADALDDARRSTAESARYNIGDMTRTINVPTIALMLLRLENQTRAEFTSGGPRYGKTLLSILRFKETSPNRFIATPDHAAATGLFWIEPKTGRVEHSELSINSDTYSAKIVVDYADQPKLKLWVPTRMTERYVLRNGGASVDGVLTAQAEYQNFRRFETKAGLIIK
jgi:hypothetical protein